MAVISAAESTTPGDDTSQAAMVGMFMYAFQLISPEATALLEAKVNSRYGPRGPYDIVKSNGLHNMLEANDRWFRHFFR